MLEHLHGHAAIERGAVELELIDVAGDDTNVVQAQLAASGQDVLALSMRPTFWILAVAWGLVCLWGLVRGPRKFYATCLLLVFFVGAAGFAASCAEPVSENAGSISIAPASTIPDSRRMVKSPRKARVSYRTWEPRNTVIISLARSIPARLNFRRRSS